MKDTTIDSLRAELEALRQHLDRLAAKVAGLAAGQPMTAAPPPPPPEPKTIPQEVVLAISAALAAYFGKRPSIRQIRLVGSRDWAQEGRVSIQASRRLSVARHHHR